MSNATDGAGGADYPWPPDRHDPSALESYREADLAHRLIPLHKWDAEIDGRLRGKSPRDNGWQKRETPYTAEEIAANTVVSGNTGFCIPPGMVVLDLDAKKVPDGRDLLAEVEEKYGVDLSAFPRVVTGAPIPGNHVYGWAHAISGAGLAKNNLPGFPKALEFKAAGKQMVAPGSLHPESGRLYRWAEGSPPLADAPQWPPALVTDLLKSTPGPRSKAQREIDPDTVGVNASAAGPEIPEGERNDTLTRIAGRLRRYDVDAEQIAEKLAEVNAARCRPPLPQNDLATIAKSVARYEPAPPDLGDSDNARRFVRLHGDVFRHCETLGDGIWFGWDGRIWRKGLRARPKVAAQDVARDLRCEMAVTANANRQSALAKEAKAAGSRAKISAMLDLAGAHLEIDPNDLDANWTLLALPNGTLELHPDGSVVRREHRQGDMISRMTAAPYDPDATCPLWGEILQRFVPEPEMHDYLQRAMGYTLLGGQSEKAIFIPYGNADGGKSTVVGTCGRALGDYAVTTRLATFGIGADLGGNTPSLALLHGPRLVLIPEVPPTAAFGTGTLKAYAGGDEIEACQKHERPFTFRPAGKLWLLANHQPEVPYDDTGVWRRINVLPFEHPIPRAEQKDGIEKRINLAAVFAWMVRGYAAWRKTGLKPPQKVEAAVAEYRDSQDPLATFVAERLELRPAAEWERQGEVYAEYQDSARRERTRNPLSRPAFARALVARPGIAKGRAPVKGGPEAFFGIRLRGRPSGDVF